MHIFSYILLINPYWYILSPSANEKVSHQVAIFYNVDWLPSDVALNVTLGLNPAYKKNYCNFLRIHLCCLKTEPDSISHK